ncbi:hypothetical protein GTW25_00215 [Aliihoeflea aestuarii]|jgi:hypothetical protein|uniref:hypothetical protein n=1 Tax=Aliihoeflea aestuarii TaxID=453840 RepID=UPI002091FD5F|nr:hypothetical protein [Aliihoeflea aestuarii]MCO6389454.1 hypothetical protein [Aliihoeflea aestuarii]
MHQMLMTALGTVCAVFATIGTVTAMSIDITVDRLFDICEAPAVSVVAQKGDELGWRRLTDAETQEWHTSFVAYNGGSVEIVGWQREEAGKLESLSFWIAVGPNGHTACAYSTEGPSEFLGALSERLGPPDNFDRNDAVETISASWIRGATQYSFVQVGSRILVNIGTGG